MTESAPRKAPQAGSKPAGTKPASTEQAGTEQATSDAEQPVAAEAETTASPAGTPDTHVDAKADMDEVKRKFREALGRKREINAEGSAASGREPNKIHNAHGPARSRRDFRRKSG